MSTIITKPKVEIAEDLLEQLKTLTRTESQVIIHCLFDATNIYECLIRIWPTTYLYDKGSAHRSELVHAENISMYPVWTTVPDGSIVTFSLIFTGLPKHCQTFDLIESIPQSGGFKVDSITRNELDVYYVWV